jgi:hypothetical protein
MSSTLCSGAAEVRVLGHVAPEARVRAHIRLRAGRCQNGAPAGCRARVLAVGGHGRTHWQSARSSRSGHRSGAPVCQWCPGLTLGEAPRDRERERLPGSTLSRSVPARLTCRTSARRPSTLFWSHARSWWFIRDTSADVLVCGCLAGHDLGLRPFLPLVPAAESGMSCACSLSPGQSRIRRSWPRSR